jgi:hypothetical protein
MDNPATGVAVIVALTQVVKMWGAINIRYIPTVAVLLGIVYALVTLDFSWMSGITGAVWGLTSVGLYSGVKNTLK